MDRRQFLRRTGLVAGAVLAGTPFRLLGRPAALPDGPVERMFFALGTTVRFQVYHPDAGAARAAIREAAALVQQIHNLMSVQDPGSELSAWNRSPRGLERPFDALTAAALDEAMSFHARTGGLVDPTVGAAVEAAREGRRVAPQSDRAAGWDAPNRRFRKEEAGVRLDLGGTAKGWAVDRAMERLVRAGATAALVNAGGDLRVHGAPPAEAAWMIGLRDPRDPDALFATLSLRDAAVATSGDYEEAGSTLIDPRDLSCVRLRGSVSVVAPTCGAADCLATALAVEPRLDQLPAGTDGVIARDRGEELRIHCSPALRAGLRRVG